MTLPACRWKKSALGGVGRCFEAIRNIGLWLGVMNCWFGVMDYGLGVRRYGC